MNRRPAQFNPDTLPVLLLLLAVLGASAAASFTLSFAGLSAVAPWAALPPHLAWLIPVASEVSLIGFVIAAFVRMHRGTAAWRVWTLVWAWTLALSTINALHAWDAGPKGWQGIVGATIAASFPVITAITAHTVAGLAFAALPEVDAAPTPRPVAVLEDVVNPVLVAPSAVASLKARRAAREARKDVERARASRSLDEAMPQIRELVATTDLSGRKIAAQLGTPRTPTCAVVAELRKAEGQAGPEFELVQEAWPA